MGYEDEISIRGFIGMVWSAVASIGWYLIIIGGIIIYYLPNIKEIYSKWKNQKEERDYAAFYHKNPDIFQEKLLGMQQARQKMQEKYNQSIETTIRKVEVTNETTLSESEEECNNSRLLESKSNDSAGPSNSKSKKLRSEYNPLMGDTSRGYRPPKRSCCGKGGCG